MRVSKKSDILLKTVTEVKRHDFIACCDAANIDYDTFNPYDNWCTIIYKYDKNDNIYNILGYMKYGSKFDMLPIVCINSEIFPYDKHKQCNNELFLLPWLTNKKMDIHVNDMLIRDRVRNIIDNNYTNTSMKDILTFVFIQLAGSINKLFYNKQWKIFERNVFMKAFENITEDWLIKILKYNEIPLDFFDIVDGTFNDKIMFYNSHPTDTPPTMWFNVLLVDVPIEMMLEREVYKGGYVHLSYVDIKYYIWSKICLKASIAKTKIWMQDDDDSPFKCHIYRTEKRIKFYNPLLEKILVDLFAEEKLFYFYQGAELMHIYENAIKNYTLNYTKLFSYARRREREQNIKQFMTNHMYHLVKDIIE